MPVRSNLRSAGEVNLYYVFLMKCSQLGILCFLARLGIDSYLESLTVLKIPTRVALYCILTFLLPHSSSFVFHVCGGIYDTCGYGYSCYYQIFLEGRELIMSLQSVFGALMK